MSKQQDISQVVRSNGTKSSYQDRTRNRWAWRTLLNLVCLIIGVLGITTLNGYAASGFTHVPNAFMQIFGSMFSPVPKAPSGYIAATPSLLSNDLATGKDKYLGQNVAVYGMALPWTDDQSLNTKINGPNDVHIQGIKSRPGTFVLALYADPEEHPDMSARPITITVRVGEQWQKEHEGIQRQWVQVLGAVVAYNPGGGEPLPEIQSTDVRVIPEPYDIYDHNIPLPKPGADND